MPTSNPRVNVTLSLSLDSLVRRMAAVTRVSKSQVLRELLEVAEPDLHRAVALMEAASKADAEGRARLADRLQRYEQVTTGALSGLASDLVSQAEAIRGKRPAKSGSVRATPERGRAAPERARKRKDPPASNRGVKSPANSETGGKRLVVRKARGSR